MRRVVFESDSLQLVTAIADGSSFSDLHGILSDIYLLSISFAFVSFSFCRRETLCFEDSAAKKLSIKLCSDPDHWTGLGLVLMKNFDGAQKKNDRGINDDIFDNVLLLLMFKKIRWQCVQETKKKNVGTN